MDMTTPSPIHLSFERPSPDLVEGYRQVATTTLCDLLTLDSVMRLGIKPLWAPMPRLAGPAFTVKTAPHDNLMLHAAIYRAQPGDLLIVQAGDHEMAVAGGNVCAVAQKRGIAGFVIDGVLRDVAECRERAFPVLARGCSPIPAGKEGPGEMGHPITCGGVTVHPGDIVVADEEGIVVVPLARAASLLKDAQAKAAKDAKESLEDWEKKHRAKIESILRDKGYVSE